MGVIGIGGTTIATSIVSITATGMTGMTAGVKDIAMARREAVAGREWARHSRPTE